jgi:hypothetical protein
LEGVECCTVAALKALPAADLKAIGFRPEVRSRLQKHIADDSAVADYKEEEVYVTVDEEEEAIEIKNSSSAGKKKKSGKKAGNKAQAPAGAHTPVPGEGGEAMEPELAIFLEHIGEKNRIAKFQEKHLTSFDSLKLMSKKSLIDVLGIPDAKAGLLVSRTLQGTTGEAPVASQARRLPELHHDLRIVVDRMNIPEKERQRVRTCLQGNDVLSVADAQAKRFAMMNELGLTCDEATELGRLLVRRALYRQRVADAGRRRGPSLQIASC